MFLPRFSRPILILLILFYAGLFWACKQNRSRDTASHSVAADWIFEGWACAPALQRARKGLGPLTKCNATKIPEHLYLKVRGKASIKAIASQSRVQKLESCRAQARSILKDSESIVAVLGAYIESTTDSNEDAAKNQARAIVKQRPRLVQGTQIYRCCPAIAGSRNCSAEEGRPTDWQACVCVSSIRFPGGEESFSTALAESSPE